MCGCEQIVQWDKPEIPYDISIPIIKNNKTSGTDALMYNCRIFDRTFNRDEKGRLVFIERDR